MLITVTPDLIAAKGYPGSRPWIVARKRSERAWCRAEVDARFGAGETQQMLAR